MFSQLTSSFFIPVILVFAMIAAFGFTTNQASAESHHRHHAHRQHRQTNVVDSIFRGLGFHQKRHTVKKVVVPKRGYFYSQRYYPSRRGNITFPRYINGRRNYYRSH